MSRPFHVAATFLLGVWVALAPVYAWADAYGPPPLTNPITGLQGLNGYVPNFGALYGPAVATTSGNTAYAVGAAGSLYAVGDVSTLTGGAATTQATTVVTDIQANSGAVAAGGSGGSNGACTVTATTGTGTKAQFTGTVSGGALTGPLTVAVAGDYTANPTGIASGIAPNEPVTGCSLIGAQVAMTMGALGFVVQTPGSYSTVPTSPVAQGSSTGSGTGATFPLTFGPIAATIAFANFGGTLQNTILGTGAAKPTTALEITAYGYKAGAGVTTGNENTCLGWQACGTANGSFNTMVGGAGVLLSGTVQHNVVVGDTAVRNGTGITASTVLGDGALFDYSGGSIASITAIGRSAMAHFNDANPDTANDVALGNNALAGASSGSHAFLNGTGVGANTGGALTTASKFTLLGQGTGNTTFASGTDVLLIDSGNNSVDTPAAGSSHMLNVGKVLAGDTAGATNPAVCAVGMKCVLGTLRGANFNSTSDQAITIRPLTSSDTGFVSSASKYFITDIFVTNCSASLTTAKGGIYTATSKGGTIIGAITTAFTNCTGNSFTNNAAASQRLTGLANQDSTIFNAATLQLSLTTAQGSAATGDLYIVGELVN